MAGPMTEEQLQRAAARLLDFSGIDWCHVPNGGHRHPAVAAKMKAAGVKPGVPDILIFERPEGDGALYAGMAIELKVGKNGRTTHQVSWAERLQHHGWKVAVCRDLDELLGLLRAHYPRFRDRVVA